MPSQHVCLEVETAQGTWNAPSNAFPFEKFQIGSGPERIDAEDTGSGRGLSASWLGSLTASGSMDFKAYTEFLGYFFLAAGFLNDSSLTPSASAAYEHHFLPVEVADPVGHSLSVQAQHSSTIEQNVRGLLIDKLSMSVKAKEVLMMSADWLAIDETDDVADWDDGNSAPARVTPVYFGSSVKPFFFYHGVISTGGTLGLSTNEITLSGQTAAARIEEIEINIENNLDNPHTITQSKVPTFMAFQNRRINGSFVVDWSNVPKTWYNAAKNENTTFVIRLHFTAGEIESGYNYQLIVTLPEVIINTADLPDVMGSQERRKVSVEFTAVVEGTTTNTDIGISLFDGQSDY